MNSQWVDVEFEESIPPNIIRIETEDGSGEYIEIEFDENDTLKDINNNNNELNDLLHQAKDILYELSPAGSAQSLQVNIKMPYLMLLLYYQWQKHLKLKQ